MRRGGGRRRRGGVARVCGIAGWADFGRELGSGRAVIERMADAMAARGPDARGFWTSPHCLLGHRRLIVVDPAGGGQPMVRAHAGGACVLTYNGELYNTGELRRELRERGHRFLTRSDTEVLLVAYLEWGPACVERLNGIFALGLWDGARQQVVLARDRLGVKPLFYALRDGGLVFASELKGLLAHPAVEPVVDEEGLAEILGLGPSRTPGHGVFAGVRELLPGHLLLFDRRGARTVRYWRLDSGPHPDGLDATAARVRELLADAVERQLVSDVPLGTLLSGGLDSSAVTAFAAEGFAREGRGPLPTFSVDYVGNDRHFRPNEFLPDPDAPYIRLMAERCGTHHTTVWLDTPELVEHLEAGVRARDLPGMADIDVSLLLFCRGVRERVTVALSGEGADEVFGGYPWFHRDDLLASPAFPWVRRVRERAALLRPGLAEALRLEEYVAERYRQALAEVPRLPGEDPVEARRREVAYLSLTRFLPTLLDRKDRMSMAWGLEVRVPFLDHRLVEYAWNIPWSLKACDGRGKGILRRALAGVLPPQVLERRKTPYPKTQHPGYAEAVRQRLQAVLADPASPLRQLVDAAAVRELMETGGPQFEPAWFGQLMGGVQLMAFLLQVDAWLREYRVRVRVRAPVRG